MLVSLLIRCYRSLVMANGAPATQGSMLPNFLILGAAKAGSTSLYRYIGQHPDVFMSPSKEPDFFVWAGKNVDIRGPEAERVRQRVVPHLADYRELFGAANRETALGEASTAYLYTPDAPLHIRKHIPEAKLIAILRNPIDRAYSAFLHARRAGYEPLADFEEALAAEPIRIRDRWGGLTHYTTVGMYAQQLERYTSVFPQEQIRIYLYEDMVRDPCAVVQDAFGFLDVDPTFEPHIMRPQNKGVVVRSRRLHSLMSLEKTRSIARHLLPSGLRSSLYFAIRRRNRLPIDPIRPQVRASLAHLFEPEIARLSRMLGRDLSPWLESGEVSGQERGEDVGTRPVGGN